jgi:hypothetical protein
VSLKDGVHSKFTYGHFFSSFGLKIPKFEITNSGCRALREKMILIGKSLWRIMHKSMRTDISCKFRDQHFV